MKHIAAVLMFCLATLGGVNAQPVYRCGNVYSQTPCPQGRIVEATDPRSAAQREDARRVAADERRLAAEMRRDRLADQAALKPAAASSLSGPPPVPAKSASSAERGHSKKRRRTATKPAPTTDIIAIDPSTRTRRSRK